MFYKSNQLLYWIKMYRQAIKYEGCHGIDFIITMTISSLGYQPMMSKSSVLSFNDCLHLLTMVKACVIPNGSEMEMSSFWWNCHHWLHWKLSFWQLSVQPVMTISSKWQNFHSTECPHSHLDLLTLLENECHFKMFSVDFKAALEFSEAAWTSHGYVKTDLWPGGCLHAFIGLATCMGRTLVVD